MSDERSESSSLPRAALRKCLADLGLPSALLSGVSESYKLSDSRLVVVENSSFMKMRDSHVGRSDSSGRVERVDNVTRWEELQEVFAFNLKVASSCRMPTKYWLLNKPTGETEGCSKKFALCWRGTKDIHKEMIHIQHMMGNVALHQSRCELISRISHLTKIIGKEEPNLLAREKKITVILYTQGMPTNSDGQSSTAIRREFREKMSSLSKLPVRVIVRLCTDDEKVRNMYNDMDGMFDSIDVLDDYWGEAMEVHLHNPWLTYGIGLHRLRETGLVPDIFGDLDQRPLTLDEIHLLCQMLFIGEDTNAHLHLPIPPYQPTTLAQFKPFIRAIEALLEKEKLQYHPVKKCMMPWIDLKKLLSTIKEQLRESFDHPDADTNPASPDPADDIPHHRQNQYKAQRQHLREDLTLEQVIKRWSHQRTNPKKPNSLQHLLVTVPQLFPPINGQVEEHAYFKKWKQFDKEAFVDISDDRSKSLLQRALRKAKFFLHPDKLPKDLTANQTLLFRTMWDAIAQGESTTFRR